ncbi:MAG: hypothetical protein AAGH65_06485 [Pseudomonadota bacterium]
MRWISVLLAWAIAVVVAVLAGSAVQTHYNMARIVELGVPVSLMQRLQATWHDWMNFAPIYAILIVLTYLIAWLVAGMLQRLMPEWRTAIFILAGGLSIWTLIVIMNGVLPITGIAATRTGGGVLAMSLAGAVAGWLYVTLAPKPNHAI